MTRRLLRWPWVRRLTWLFIAPIALLGAIGAPGCGGCGKAPPEPAAPAAGGDASPVARGPMVIPARVTHELGHAGPRAPFPSESASAVPRASREPDWDLDSDDPARDYVRRYALGTKRYGETLACVDIGPSKAGGDKRRVEVATAPGCAGAGTVRDVFVVDVASDRLSVEDTSAQVPLARWPDGSDPDGPPGRLPETTGIKEWKSPLKEELQKHLLVPIRVQAYGRGTYPVVTLAGWHGAVVPTTGAEALRGLAEALCKASGGAPMGLLGGVDCSTMLRVRCPGQARWDTL